MPALEAVFFDGGDTLMRVLPYEGRMVEWPEVAAVDGAAEALMQLRRRYKLAVLTNAQESSAADVAAAMRRVGLDVYITTYITSRDIGVLKPDPAFFRAGLQALDVAADQAVMVGDYYEADVLGARGAGLAAVWYNPHHDRCPDAHPAYDAMVTDLRDLPAVLAAPFLPDTPTCLRWLVEQGATGPLIPHVRLVAAVAFRLAEQLAAAGARVDPLLAHRGGLLHDLARVSARTRGVSHELEAGRLLRERGLDALARIAERHPVWAPLTPGRQPETWEEKLVYYADRISEPSGIVSIEERLAAMLARRGEQASSADEASPVDGAAYRAAARAMEQEIARRLGMASGDIMRWLKSVIDDPAG